MLYLLISLALCQTVSHTTDCYLISGKLSRENKQLDVFIAIDGDRAVAGVASDSSAIFTWVNGSFDVAQINFGPTDSAGQHLWDNRQFGAVGLMKRFPDDSGFVFSDRVCTSAFSLVSFAALFRAPLLGVNRFELSELQDLQNEYGKLQVDRDDSGGLLSIEFVQGSESLLAATKKERLADIKRQFESGYRSIRRQCRFSPALTESVTAWTAECRLDRTSMNGEVQTQIDILTVSEFSSDSVKVREAISAFLDKVPNDARVLTTADEPISYVWRNDHVERNLGESALAVAAEAEFDNSTNRRWLWMLLALSTVAVFVIFWIGRQSKAEQ